MPKLLSDIQVIEYVFATNLVRYMKCFNLIDSNLGLCIAWLTNPKNSHAVYPLIENLNTQGKINSLKKMIFDRYSETNKEMVAEFDQWFKIACNAKSVRNLYIHGYWDVDLTATGNEKPITFSPITWVSGKSPRTSERDQTQYFSLNEFKDVVRQIEKILHDFNALRDKYHDFLIC